MALKNEQVSLPGKLTEGYSLSITDIIAERDELKKQQELLAKECAEYKQTITQQ